jgi:hypothetical protein
MLHNIEVVIGADFQDFDHEGTVPACLPDSFDGSIAVGDRVWWVCAQFDGIAEVVEIKGNQLFVKKWQ